MKRLNSFVSRIGFALTKVVAWSGSVSAVGFFVMMAFVTIAVISRRVLGKPLVFSEEYSAYLFVFCVYFGGAYTLREDAHIRVDVVTLRLGARLRNILRALTSLLGIIYGLILTVYTVKLVVYYKEIGHEALSVLETPTWIPAMSVPIGCAILTFQMIMTTIQDFKSIYKEQTESS